MKLFFFILAAGLASAHITFNVGQEHVFKYHGKVLTGLPEIDAHFAGFTIACDVLIQPTDATTYKLALKNVQFAKFHDRLEGPVPMNWRTLITPVPGPVDAHFLPFLESPVLFKMVQGKATNIQVSGDEPQWTVNLKKALLDLIKIQFPASGADFFQVMEEGIDGICENTYTVTELPAYLVKDPTLLTAGLLKPELCTGKKIFQITKLRDVTKCKTHNLYISRAKMATVVKARTHVTKFVGCGATVAAIMLHGAIHEGEIVHNIGNMEPMVTGVHQMLQLFEVKPTLSQLPVIANPAAVQTVLYEFPVKSDIVHHHTMVAPFAKYTATPLKWEQVRTQIPGFHVATFKAEIIKQLREIARDIATVENFHKKVTVPKLMNVLRHFLKLTAEEMKALHLDIQTLAGVEGEVKDRMVFLFFDVATMAGNAHSVQFLKHIVETGQIHAVRILTTIISLGHHVRTPTVEILNHIFNIVKSPVVMKYKLIKHNALLNFANLLNKACVVKNEPKRFPAEVFGEYCTSATSEIVTTYIPYILNEFKASNDEEYKEVCLFALGTIGHEAAIPILLPYIQGKIAGHTVPLRIKSIWALNTVVRKHKHILLPVFTTIFDNPVEHRPVRLAALSMVLKAEPSLTLMQKIAIQTWHEKDPEMVKFIFATLKSLSEKDFGDMANVGHFRKVAAMARTVMPLAKPLPGMLFYTGSAFCTEYLKDLYAGYEVEAHFMINPHGNGVFHKMMFIMDQIKLPALELVAHLRGEKTLFDQLRHVFAEVFGIPQKDNAGIWNILHAEWKKIVKDMKIKPRDDVPFSTFLFMNMFDDVVAHVGVNQFTLDAVKPWFKSTVGPILKDPKAAIQAFCNKKIPINFVHATRLMSTEIVHATEMGLPLVTEVQTPILFAVHGHIQLTDCGAPIPAVEVALKTKIITDYYTYTGAVIPLTKEMAYATTKAHLSVNKPFKAVIKVEPATRKMIVKMMPFVEPTATAVDFIHYHVQALTGLWKIDDFVFETQLARVKNIRVNTTPTKVLKPFGLTVGLDMKLDVEADTELIDIYTLVDRLALYKYNPLNMIMFPGHLARAKRNGKLSKCFNKMTLLYNPAGSALKEVHVTVDVAIAKMITGFAPVQYNIQYLPKFNVIETPLTKANPIEIKLFKALKEKLNINANYAVHTLFNIELKGAPVIPLTFGLTAGLGLAKNARKWHVDAEVMPTTAYEFHICTTGRLDKPVIPAWNIQKLLADPINFNFKNKIGYGKTCDEYMFNFDGIASVSEMQKAFAFASHEAVLCRTALQSSQQHVPGLLPKHIACHKQRDQAATIDQVVLNLGPVTLPAYLPAWIANIRVLKKVTLHLNTKLYTLNIKAFTTAGYTYTYKKIRLPWALHGVFPLIAGKFIHEQVHEAIMGAPFRPTCHVTETGHIQTFDKRFYKYQMDNCYHVVASDCTAKLTTAVLAKHVPALGMKHAKVYHMGAEFKFKFPKVMYNGQPIEIPPNFEKIIKGTEGVYIIKRTVDDVFILDTPVFVVKYNGHKIKVKSKQLKITGQLCGLCGDNNKDSRFDLKSPTNCVYKSNLLAALSYRHQTAKCPALPKEHTDMIAAEEAQCAIAVVPFYQQFQPAMGSRMKHYIIRNVQNQMCISKNALPSCQPSHSPMSNMQPMVQYTCISHPSNKVVKHYEQKVNSGAMLPELTMLDTHIAIPTTVPQYCSRV